MEMMWFKGKYGVQKHRMEWSGTGREHPRNKNGDVRAQNKGCTVNKWGEGERRVEGQEQGARPRSGILGKDVGNQGTRKGSEAQGWG